jgi:hypothetical protein
MSILAAHSPPRTCAAFRKQCLVQVRLAALETYRGGGKVQQPGAIAGCINKRKTGIAVCCKSRDPCAACQGIVQPQVFDSENFEPCALSGANDVGQLGQLAAGEHVPLQECRRAIVVRVLRTRDALVEYQAVRCEQRGERKEIALQPVATNMLAHPDRRNLVEPARNIPIVKILDQDATLETSLSSRLAGKTQAAERSTYNRRSMRQQRLVD